MPPVYEEWLAFVAAQLPAPVAREEALDGSVYFTGGDPAQIIVRLTRATLTIWEYAVVWEGPQTPVVRPIRAGSIAWRRLSNTHAFAAARALMDATIESRLSKFGTCTHCGQRRAPELMHDDDVCQACAQRDLGVIY